MGTPEIKKKLHEYIELAPKEKLKAIYTLLESDIENDDEWWWKDEAFVAEMERRVEEIKSGKVKAISIEELFSNLNKVIEKKKKVAV